MKISILRRYGSENYLSVFDENRDMYCLSTFLTDDLGCYSPIINSLIHDLYNIDNFQRSYNSCHICKEGPNFDITELYGPDQYDLIPVKINTSDMILFLESWKNICIKKPQVIILQMEKNKINLEGIDFCFGYLDETNFKNFKFNDSARKNIFSKIFLDNEFVGGFHYLDDNIDNENIILNEKAFDENKTLSASFELGNNFILNHSFFKKNTDLNEYTLTNEISKIMSCEYFQIDKCIEVENSVFSLTGYIENGTCVKIIINENFEILTTYPIFGVKK